MYLQALVVCEKSFIKVLIARFSPINSEIHGLKVDIDHVLEKYGSVQFLQNAKLIFQACLTVILRENYTRQLVKFLVDTDPLSLINLLYLTMPYSSSG